MQLSPAMLEGYRKRLLLSGGGAGLLANPGISLLSVIRVGAKFSAKGRAKGVSGQKSIEDEGLVLIPTARCPEIRGAAIISLGFVKYHRLASPGTRSNCSRTCQCTCAVGDGPAISVGLTPREGAAGHQTRSKRTLRSKTIRWGHDLSRQRAYTRMYTHMSAGRDAASTFL